MHKIYTLLLATFLFNITLSHANNAIDSIGVENNQGKKLILHKVEAKETYYSLAKKYNVNYKDIMTYNDSKLLQIGIIIKIPTALPFAAAAVVNTNNAIEHTVKAKENLNLLAEKYGTTVNDIKVLNGLNSNNLQIGQVLKIPSPTTVAANQTAQVTTPTNLPQKQVSNPPVENTATINHTINPKENLNLIAKQYGTTVDEIKRLNGLSSINLQVGQVLKVPSSTASVLNTTTEVTTTTPIVKTPQKTATEKPVVNNTTDGGFEHTVIAGETIYTIAKKYNQTTYQLKTANNLTGNELTVGQKLMIKGAKPTVAFNETEPDDAEAGNTIKDPNLKYPASKYGLTQVEEKGTAVWIADTDLDAAKMLVLHKTAPVGTVIKITNPMSNRSTFAKVVGKFTENETTKDVIIVMTKAVADAVGALDKRFFCNLTYGAQENEQ